jgi:hypothetical protein
MKFLSVFVCAAVALFVFVLLIEWAVGCGEKTYNQDRTWQTNACVFLPHKIKQGMW